MSRIIFLHGASSSGKSTLAQAIRAASPDPWMHLCFDTFRDSGALKPDSYPNWPDKRSAVFSALHQSFQAFADAGLDLIVEHILDTPGWHANLQQRFASHDLLFVGLHTSSDALDTREKSRVNRARGSAREDATRIHAGLNYDLELDGTAPPQFNAKQVLTATPSPGSAFFASSIDI